MVRPESLASFLLSGLVTGQQTGWWTSGRYSGEGGWSWGAGQGAGQGAGRDWGWAGGWHPRNSHSPDTEGCAALLEQAVSGRSDLAWLSLPCAGRNDSSIRLLPLCEKYQDQMSESNE